MTERKTAVDVDEDRNRVIWVFYMKREIYSTKIEDKAYFVFYLYLYKGIFGKSAMLIANYPNLNPYPNPNSHSKPNLA